MDEPVPGYPKRPVPRDEDSAKALKKRTLTNLYNVRPQWLADAHDALDAAVAAAYGWSAGISHEDTLRELLALNGGWAREGRCGAVRFPSRLRIIASAPGLPQPRGRGRRSRGRTE